MVTLFGTDGVRGVVNSTLMPELAFQLGRAAGAYFCREEGTHRVLIGMDTRWQLLYRRGCARQG